MFFKIHVHLYGPDSLCKGFRASTKSYLPKQPAQNYLLALSPFPKMFSKGYILRVFRSPDFLVKSQHGFIPIHNTCPDLLDNRWLSRDEMSSPQDLDLGPWTYLNKCFKWHIY